jgi:apolipoprotein D and lipocalin family protein
MIRRLWLLALVLGLAACVAGPSGRSAEAPPLTSVDNVDISRFMGRWYEIARYPNGFQRDCEGVTAEYSLRPDGRVGVVNTCRTGTRDGNPRRAEAFARVIDGSGGARLFVNFSPVPLLAGRGNYWVLFVDPDYRHALIGEPSGRFLWMLAREPRISAEVRAELDAVALAAGYDLTMLKETEQP